MTSVGNAGCPSRCIVVDKRLSSCSITANNVSYNANVNPVVRTTHVVTLSNTGPGHAVLFITFTKRRFKLLNTGTCIGARTGRLKGVTGLFGQSKKPAPPIKVSIPRTVCSSFIRIYGPIGRVHTSCPFRMGMTGPFGHPARDNNASTDIFTIRRIPAFNFGARSVGKCGFSCKRV